MEKLSVEITENTENACNNIIDNLNHIRNSIESMNKFNQIETLRILKNHPSVFLNENKYGVHINLSELDETILHEIKMYINYVSVQETLLNKGEKQKQDYKNTYFTKDIKDN